MVKFLVAFCLSVFIAASASATTLEDVRARGVVNCGVDEQHYGFAYLDEFGEWTGFEVEFCRALAAAIFQDANKVFFVPLNAQTRFTALKNRQIDVLLRSTTWTYTRDATLGFDFPSVTFYDHLAILAHKSVGVKRLDDVIEASLCVANSTTTEETVREYVESTGKPIRIKVFNSREGLNNFFFSGQCDLYAADHSALKSIVMGTAPKPDNYYFLETSLSKEPLGPVVREDDREWYELVKWMIFGMIEAEERGISKLNVEAMKRSQLRSVKFMLGVTPGFGRKLGLQDSWLADVIGAVGNYGEIFERHLGMSSTIKMERGLNALWRNGGLMYSMPIR
ncbi:amino acid ABC transporter substrate-binding protein [Terasakiella sp. A23]|uniref:amino acid ABC transporter substrate-binding protein n=1 Tax=Terasakiella sp. FCG-A23 TaxID=3080561 RepID=UPI0029553951|nr:amino acid ABC transporter substrate-binding protein [Terasakiella sp. A23]MDV7341324.1 amino acid ABC transporter substrate-binding protein [Terasakiella sp. A23]